ncbi:MAG: nitroreductase family protein [Candidatus Zixiibacteriota bacterium]
MKIDELIEKRRSYRALEPIEITKDMIHRLANSAKMAPSCFNNQPWRFVFVQSKEMLEKMRDAMMKGNEWTYDASMIIAVISKKDLDCSVKGMDYYKFDVGMSVGIMMLKATEMGLVAHAIAGYKKDKVREILDIPEEYDVITLINVGKHGDYKDHDNLSDKQVNDEKERPPRKEFTEFASIDKFDIKG